jgi:hypothetical protein
MRELVGDLNSTICSERRSGLLLLTLGDITIASAERTRYRTKRNTFRIRHDSQHNGIIATMNRTELVGGVSITDASAPSILHSMLTDRNRVSHDQMEAGPVFPLPDAHLHRHENIHITTPGIMNSQPGMPTTLFLQKWTSLQSQKMSLTILSMRKSPNLSPNPNPDVGLVIIYLHHTHVHAATPTTHTHGNHSAISHPPHHEEVIEDTITRSPSPFLKQENQTQTERPDFIITTTVLAPDPQVSSSKNLYLTSLTQLQPQPQPQPQSLTQQCTCLHHHGHPPATDIT